MSNDVITQEKIELLLRNAGQVEEPLNIDDYLSAEERDVLGEIGNMCMGASVTTMNELLGRKVTITTPNISIHTPTTLGTEYPTPLVVVEVQYTDGIIGNNLLLLQEYDVALITDLLIGGEGNIDPKSVVLDEIQLSAIREVMNQMVGASATTMATILNTSVNISTPSSRLLLLADDTLSQLIDEKILVKISFKMTIEGLLKSEIMQIWPCSFAKKLVRSLLNPEEEAIKPPMPVSDKSYEEYLFASSTQSNIDAIQNEIQYTQAAELYNNAQTAKPQPQQAAPSQGMPSQSMPVQAMPAQAMPAQAMPVMPAATIEYAPAPVIEPIRQSQAPSAASPIRRADSVDAKTVRYPSFDVPATQKQNEVPIENLGLLMEVPMRITVELGKTRKKIREILDFNTGSVVVLDKLAGGSVDILVNGTPIARGEVVVVDENYGVRIVEINTDKLRENL